jgi:hypothetical protein
MPDCALAPALLMDRDPLGEAVADQDWAVFGGTLMVFLATGVALPEAFALMAQTYSREAVLPHLLARLDGQEAWPALAFLEEVAAADADLARMGLATWGHGRDMGGCLCLSDRGWVTDLPGQLRVRGVLDLSGTAVVALPRDLELGDALYLRLTPITALPTNLRVPGSLDLCGSALRSLPTGLRVAGNLGLQACWDWDGRVPADAQVGGWIHTPKHPLGIRLPAWRAACPCGEGV